LHPETGERPTFHLEDDMRIQHHITLGLFLGGLLSMIASPAAAQTTATGVGLPYVWIHEHTGIIQEPINTAQTYDGVNRIAEKLGLKGRGSSAKAYRIEALDIMEHGTPVVVHSAVKDDDDQAAGAIDQSGPGALMSTKGRVTSIDRVHGNIAVQYNDGRIDRLRLMTPRSAAAQAGTLQAKGRRVIVYSSNKSGQQVAQYFKRKA
jgi:hypothetical protein